MFNLVSSNRSFQNSAALAAAIGLAAGSACAVVPTITNLGTPAGATETQAIAVSGDGSVAVGNIDPFGPGPASAYRWTSSGGFQNVGTFPAGGEMWGLAVSGDGSTTVGIAFPPDRAPLRAYRARNGVVEDLGVLPGGIASEGYGVSSDGSAVCGNSSTADSYRAFRWTSAGMQDLGTLPGGTYSFGWAISGDGNTVVGYGDTDHNEQAFKWTSSGGMQELGMLTEGDASGAFAANADGSAFAGYSGANAVVWNSTGIHDMGFLPGGTFAMGYAISGDGRVAGGGCENADGAFVATFWTASTGMVDLASYLSSRGTDMTGWELDVVAGISYDGTTMVGVGRYNGEGRGWIATLPRICPADFNQDDIVDFFDYLDFVQALASSAPDADFNADEEVDFFDYIDFVEVFATGC